MLGSVLNCAQDWARQAVDKSPRRREWVTAKHDGRSVESFVARAPVYGFYAGTDARIDATVPATQERMKAAGKSFEAVTYEGAAHGFMRAGAQPDATEANKKARAEAWVKLRALRGRFK